MRFTYRVCRFKRQAPLKAITNVSLPFSGWHFRSTLRTYIVDVVTFSKCREPTATDNTPLGMHDAIKLVPQGGVFCAFAHSHSVCTPLVSGWLKEETTKRRFPNRNFYQAQPTDDKTSNPIIVFVNYVDKLANATQARQAPTDRSQQCVNKVDLSNVIILNSMQYRSRGKRHYVDVCNLIEGPSNCIMYTG